jgi:hypothetical protein
MLEAISVFAGLLSIVAMVPYIADTIKGKTKPNVVSWFTWTLLTGIGAFAAFSEGAITTAIFSGASALATLSVVILSFWYGVKRFTRFDVWCQIAALVGVVLWQVTNDATIAIAVVVVTDMIAALPTIRHAWFAPDAETWQTFVISGVGALITIFTITQISFAAFAYPIWLVIGNLAIAGVVVYRRRQRKHAAA